MDYNVSFNLDFKRNSYPGRFIVLEGMDGSGKTTQAQIVVENLKAKGVDVVYTKDPTDGIIGSLIRQAIDQKIKVSPIAFQHLLSADRGMHEVEIIDLLKKGKTVLSDRYLWSSVAYGIADREDLDYTNGKVLLVAQSILSMYHQFVIPDLTLYLRVSVDKALARLRQMDKEQELYENREKLTKVFKGYEWLSKEFPKEITVLDGEQEVSKVTETILENLKF